MIARDTALIEADTDREEDHGTNDELIAVLVGLYPWAF